MLRNVKKEITPYGGFSDIKEYLKTRYSGDGVIVNPGKSLVIEESSMEQISGKRVNNCSIVSISKVIDYYRKIKGCRYIADDIKRIYQTVENYGCIYGYSDEKGTFPTKINNITKDTLSFYGYKSKCNGCYTWSFEKTVKREIDKERPVMMSLLRGFYRDHTITVSGYSIWKVNDRVLPILKVIDGWRAGCHYIDFIAFEEDLINAGIGSFNITKVYDQNGCLI
ncbi:MAG: C39 family peptidase [Lachnospiraceae bacterium]|nr:C39 family peptidase [Lachnospiraceae bacterium]